MADITGTTTIYPDPRAGINSPGIKRVYAVTLATADTSDTFDLTINDYVHGGVFLGITGWRHSTENSVIVAESGVTTSVTTGVLTVTLGSGVTNHKCVYEIILGQGI